MENKRKIGIRLVLIALAPIYAHIALVYIAILKNNYTILRMVDSAIMVVALIYVALIYTLSILNNKEWLIRLTFVAYSFIFALICTELSLHFLNEKTWYNVPWHPIKSDIAAEGVMPGIHGKIDFSVNKYGLRGPNKNLDKADIKILAVGGSTTECLYVTDKLSWPWKFQDYLSDRLKKDVFVGNAGRSGHFTLNYIYLLQAYKYAPEFDWVIILPGINDMSLLLQGTYEERKQKVPYNTFASFPKPNKKHEPYYRRLRLYIRIRSFITNILSRSVIMQDKRGLWYVKERQKRRDCLKKHAIDQIPSELDEALVIYKENLKKIIDICRQRNQNILILTQPTIWRKDLPAKLEKLLWYGRVGNAAYTTETLEKIIKRYNRATIDVCMQEGIMYIDLASMVSKDTSVFYDGSHYNISGCEAIAKILSDFFYNFYISGK